MIQVKKFLAKNGVDPCKVLSPVMENVRTKFSNVSFEDIDIDTI